MAATGEARRTPVTGECRNAAVAAMGSSCMGFCVSSCYRMARTAPHRRV